MLSFFMPFRSLLQVIFVTKYMFKQCNYHFSYIYKNLYTLFTHSLHICVLSRSPAHLNLSYFFQYKSKYTHRRTKAMKGKDNIVKGVNTTCVSECVQQTKRLKDLGWYHK